MSLSYSHSELGKVVTSAILFIISFCLSVWLLFALAQQQEYTRELAEISNVKYGLFNSDKWVEQISKIVERRIDNFNVTKENRAEIHKVIARILDRLIVEVDNHLRNQRKKGGFFDKLRGATEQFVQDSLIDLNGLRRNIPQYTDRILDELEKPEAKREIKEVIIKQLNQFSNSTFSAVDMSKYNSILKKHFCKSLSECKKVIGDSINKSQKLVLIMSVVILISNLLLYSLAFFGTISKHRITILILGSGVLLLVGIFTPMIEIEAKISELSVKFYNEQIIFENQVLYYQSKSILDVVAVLIQSMKIDLIFVAFLIALFSVMFPIAKLVSSFLFYYDTNGLRSNLYVHFFALKSGKWSMADVFVIAIFMAYIGFDGMLSSQLSNLSGSGKSVDILTTNGTSIQIGFFMFLAFCLSSLLISTLIENATDSRINQSK